MFSKGDVIRMMRVSDVLEGLSCCCLAGCSHAGRPVKGGYAGDLLSWVMAHAEKDDIWLTILNSVNVIAVAELTECACVLLTEGVTMDAAVLQRAEERGVVVLQTGLTTFAAAAGLEKLLQRC